MNIGVTLNGAPVVSTAFEVHCELHRNLRRALTINLLTTLCDQPVHVRTSCLRQTFIQNVLIESVYEAIARRHFSIREFVNAAVLNVLTLTRQLHATLFDVQRILFKTCGERECRKLTSGDTCCFECPLLVRIEKFDLPFDHLPDVVRYSEFDLLDVNAQVPTAAVACRNQARLQKIVDGINHK